MSEPDRVDWSLDPEARLVVADPGLLDRVLGNVVENALRHQPPPGRVRVSTSGLGGRTQVRVCDTGPGVPEDARERIFLPFQRHGDAPSGDGVGLGLAVARGLAEAMDGEVSAEETPGGGLTMVIELPNADDPAAAGRASLADHARPPRPPPRRPPMAERILVVDDDETIRRTLRINLRARGYEVEEVASGRDALSTLEDAPPDLVILDLGLPDIDGVEVLRRLRRTLRVPVVVLSARQQSDDKVEALDQGADDYVTKPFGMDELMARVRSALRRGGADGEALAAIAPVVTDAFAVDFATLTATRNGEPVHLTPTEWRLLGELARHRGKVVTQADLLRAVWGPGYGRESNYLRVYGNQLRRKLEADPSRPRHIITEPGIGYRLVE